jgi:CRISPR-associated endonuclease/helicase Cas3
VTLVAADFPAYFRAVHDYDPFPWQTRLAAQVLDTSEAGGWPDVLAVPTGCGKTSTLDVALFALAVQPERFPRRVVMVIDRRVVVDQGYEHAKRIGTALKNTSAPVARQVAENLRALWNGKPGQNPIECALLRGGMPREDAWAQRPDRPVLALSTVDQVGSRLLFRGYGVSQKMASVHAGLLGHDTLFLLDEVHLAVPFAETLLALRDRWRGFYPNVLPDRWGVVRLSATPGVKQTRDRPPFTLPVGGEDDVHPRLKPRVQAHKPAQLREVAVRGKEEGTKRITFAAACTAAAIEWLKPDDLDIGKPRTIGVIVNRVAAAREIARQLADETKGAFDVQLLTGRMRPLDRDTVLQTLQPRIKAGRERRPNTKPLIVVATQCIEAGADFDFDALVTECASLDALKQRFGRLDRLGERHSTGLTSPAVILARSDQLAANADPDPIYGAALKASWDWLKSQGEHCDFGIRYLAEPDEDKLATLIAPRTHAPILLPAHLDAWNQTHPHPEPDPEIALWLHGPQRGEPEVQLVWRADFSEAALNLASQLDTQAGIATRDDLIARLTACPPGGAEALALPMSAVRRWLKEQSATEVADAVMQQDQEDAEPQQTQRIGRLAFNWDGDDSRALIGNALRPGMTLVVPAAYGGVAHSNWDPESTSEVADYGDLVQWQRYRRATLRLRVETLPEVLRTSTLPKVDEDSTAQDRLLAVRDWLDALPQGLDAPWSKITAALGRSPRIVVHDGGSLTVIARKPTRETVSTEDDGASFTEREVSLAEHSEDVWRWADGFAHRLGLSEAVRADLVLAAWLHDAGKADPRFQKWLVGGSAVRLEMPGALLLAKSGQSLRDRRASQQARQLAGYPDGYRHELLSVAMLANNEALLASAYDRELVLHLVGAHHGWCRPFAPFVDHPEEIAVPVAMTHGPGERSVKLSAGTRHQLARLDSGITDRFWNLTGRYGWWGLAWLETILRLADHRASAEGKGAGNE